MHSPTDYYKYYYIPVPGTTLDHSTSGSGADQSTTRPGASLKSSATVVRVASKVKGSLFGVPSGMLRDSRRAGDAARQRALEKAATSKKEMRLDQGTVDGFDKLLEEDEDSDLRKTFVQKMHSSKIGIQKCMGGDTGAAGDIAGR